MPPITIVFFVSGIAVWANAMYFWGAGADRKEGGADPLTSVGWITLVAGIADFMQAFAIMSNQLAGEASILLAGLVAIYAAFFTFLGITEVFGLDLRPLGNVCIAVALVPLFYWDFFTGSWMFQSILIVWAVVFLAIAATTYGRLQGKALSVLLFITAIYTFWTPAIILALGNEIP
ncbi:MAG TPA: AmiS/UreI family transporter [Actinomycetota bacterium]|nr:AmiS/UreI family transporter [Actinomycetota bacterium]